MPATIVCEARATKGALEMGTATSKAARFVAAVGALIAGVMTPVLAKATMAAADVGIAFGKAEDEGGHGCKDMAFKPWGNGAFSKVPDCVVVGAVGNEAFSKVQDSPFGVNIASPGGG